LNLLFLTLTSLLQASTRLDVNKST